MVFSDSTERFTDRVADYVRYRPSYPLAVLNFLRAKAGLTPAAIVADIGAGTGISSKLFLDGGYEVIAVEPNAAMRAAAEQWLGQAPKYRSVSGTAEATGLADQSVNLVTAAQAFHWFKQDAAKAEFRRILRPNGKIALFWNSRRTEGSPFLLAYERLLHEFGTDYAQVSESYSTEEKLRDWFGPGFMAAGKFDNTQLLDEEGLRGRLLSSSYAPRAGHPKHEPMLHALHELFLSTADNGKVAFAYDTRVFVGTAI